MSSLFHGGNCGRGKCAKERRRKEGRRKKRKCDGGREEGPPKNWQEAARGRMLGVDRGRTESKLSNFASLADQLQAIRLPVVQLVAGLATVIPHGHGQNPCFNRKGLSHGYGHRTTGPQASGLTPRLGSGILIVLYAGCRHFTASLPNLRPRSKRTSYLHESQTFIRMISTARTPARWSPLCDK